MSFSESTGSCDRAGLGECHPLFCYERESKTELTHEPVPSTYSRTAGISYQQVPTRHLLARSGRDAQHLLAVLRLVGRGGQRRPGDRAPRRQWTRGRQSEQGWKGRRRAHDIYDHGGSQVCLLCSALPGLSSEGHAEGDVAGRMSQTRLKRSYDRSSSICVYEKYTRLIMPFVDWSETKMSAVVSSSATRRREPA